MSQLSSQSLQSVFCSISQGAWDLLFNEMDKVFGIQATQNPKMLTNVDVCLSSNRPGFNTMGNRTPGSPQRFDEESSTWLTEFFEDSNESEADVSDVVPNETATTEPTIENANASATSSIVWPMMHCTESPDKSVCKFELSFDTVSSSFKVKGLRFYSAELKKVFTKADTPCPFGLKVDPPPPCDANVHVVVAFVNEEFNVKPVERCNNHATNGAGEGMKHIFECMNRGVVYYVDKRTNMCKAYIPWLKMSTEYSGDAVCVLSFSCFNSCPSINRQQLELRFTLETNDVVLARASVRLRVCACPARDAKLETGLVEKKSGNAEATKFSDVEAAVKKKKRRQQIDKDEDDCNDEEKIYTMEVQGRQLYKLLSNIANAHCAAMDLSRVHGELLLKSFGGWLSVCPFSAEAFDSIKSETCIEEWLGMLGKSSLERLFKAVNISIFEDVENFSKTDFIRLGMCATDAKLLKSWLIQRSVHQEQRQISSLDPSDQSERQGSQQEVNHPSTSM